MADKRKCREESKAERGTESREEGTLLNVEVRTGFSDT